MKPSELFMKKTNKRFLYNIQTIDNVPSIMQRGLLSHDKAKNISHISVANPNVQEIRENRKIFNGMPLHKYANLYFDYWNPMLCSIQSENSNLCILVFKSTVLDINNVIITDGNAAIKFDYVHFYTPEIGICEIDFDLVYAKDWRDANTFMFWHKKAIKCAEVLVPFSIPFTFVVGAIVYGNEQKQRLINVGFNLPIKVSKDSFF